MDFKQLSQYLLPYLTDILPTLLPGGSLEGNEYKTSSIHGGSGKSLSVNITTGVWCDFSTSEPGGDIIALYAAVHSITQKEAFKKLAKQYGFALNGKHKSSPRAASVRSPQSSAGVNLFIAPPQGANLPKNLNKTSAHWEYFDAKGRLLYIVSRLDSFDQHSKPQKKYRPYSWSSKDKDWVTKAWPKNRPLYGLQRLNEKVKQVILTEGEKAADACQAFLPDNFIAMSWQGGSNAFKKTDWTPLKGHNVLLWPDADQAGIDCMALIAAELHGQVSQLKVIDTTGQPDKWDAADAGFTWKTFIDWARPRASLYLPPVVEVIEKPKTKAPAIPEMTNDDYELMAHSHAAPVPPSDLQADKRSPYFAFWERLGLQINAGGSVAVDNITNAEIAIKHHLKPKSLLVYDSFYRSFMTDWENTKGLKQGYRQWTEIDSKILTRDLQFKYGLLRIKESTVWDAMVIIGRQNIINEPQDWVKKITWDKTERVSHFFQRYMGAEDNPYTQAVSRNWWIALAARLFNPGCKVDNMVILEGAQGNGKSTALSIVGGDWYLETNVDPTNKDFYQALQGKLIVELGELTSFDKGSKANEIKFAVTRRVDEFRAPYDRVPKKHERTCLLVGTTNDKDYLKDSTGGRRFWPIKTLAFDLEGIKSDRAQLYAEAYQLFKSGSTWHEVPDSAEDEQESRRSVHHWEDNIIHYIDDRQYISTYCVLKHGIGLTPEKHQDYMIKDINRILRHLGWEPGQRRSFDGVRRYAWSKSADLISREFLKARLSQDNQQPKVQQELPPVASDGPHNYAPGAIN